MTNTSSDQPPTPEDHSADSAVPKAVRRDGAVLAWLKLLRLPTLFTLISNVTCGYLLTSLTTETGLDGLAPPRIEFLWLLLSGSCLYLAGMVLNDVFDVNQDRKERPHRPIPSGAVSRGAAAFAGGALLTAGVFVSWLAGPNSVRIAAGLAVLIVLYDRLLKRTPLGPLAMGSCRFLAIFLGASLNPIWEFIWVRPQLQVAIAVGVYITGVTWFARNESGKNARWQLVAGLLVAIAGILINAGLAATWSGALTEPYAVYIALGLIAGNILIRGGIAVKSLEPADIQRTVGLMLLSLVLMDAVMVFNKSGNASLAAAVAVLIIPATLMRRVIPMT